MTDLRRIAQGIADAHIENIEFCCVYEDDEVLDLELSEEEMKEIHDLIRNGKVVLSA